MASRRSPVLPQGPQGPRTMNSLRSRRPTNLNLIVANPDSDDDSDSSEGQGQKTYQPPAGVQGQGQGQGQKPSPNNINVAGNNGAVAGGVVITAQPPTPGSALQQTPQALTNTGRRVSNEQQPSPKSAHSNTSNPNSTSNTFPPLPLATEFIPNHPFAASANRGHHVRAVSVEDLHGERDSGSGTGLGGGAIMDSPEPAMRSVSAGSVPVFGGAGGMGLMNMTMGSQGGAGVGVGGGQGGSGVVPIHQQGQEQFTVFPGMMTAPNMRAGQGTRHHANNSLPRLHTPPAYPIPLPPNTATARPTFSGSAPNYLPPQQQQQPQPQPQPQQQTYKHDGLLAGGQKIPSTGMPSPIQSSSPSSPSMSYGASQLSHNNSMSSTSGDQPRRRHDLPMLPPRPKQNTSNSNPTPNPNSNPNPNPNYPVSQPQVQGQGQSQGQQTIQSAVSQGSSTPGTAVGQKLGNVRLAVTVDNENFSVVDVAGMGSAEAIMERVFAKLRFRDDDHPSLALYRTDIGESPEPDPIGKFPLFELCKTQGDSKGTLKFLVMQTSVLPSPSSAVIPPPIGHAVVHGHSGQSSGANPYGLGSPADLSRKTFSASSASGAERDRQRVGAAGSRHSRSGSVSSQSDHPGRHELSQQGYNDTALETSPVDPTQVQGYGSATSMMQGVNPPVSGIGVGGVAGVNLTRHHRVLSRSSRRMPSTSTSRGSQSPADEKTKAAAMRGYGSPPQSMETAFSGTQSTSTATMSNPTGYGVGGYRPDPRTTHAKRGATTPTVPGWDHQMDPHTASQASFHHAGPSRSSFDSAMNQHRHPYSPGPPLVESPEFHNQNPPDTIYDAVEWEPSPSEPTEADMMLIQRMQAEEEERAVQQRKQMEEDMRVALQEQQKEHAAWEAMQTRERDARQRQIETDRMTAERAIEQDRRSADNERERERERERVERAERARSEAESMERERERQVGRERKARRLQWENKIGTWNAGMPYLNAADGSLVDPNVMSPVESRQDPNIAVLSSASSQPRQGWGTMPPLDNRGRQEISPQQFHRTPSQVHQDPQQQYYTYNGPSQYDASASLPPGATYGYSVEPAYRDSPPAPMYHTHSNPVPQVTQPLRPNRSGQRSATAQSAMPDARSYQGHANTLPYNGPNNGPRHGASHPPFDHESSYREDLARLRAQEAQQPAGYGYGREYIPPPIQVPQLAFPEPQPFFSPKLDRRGSESGVAPYSQTSSNASSRRASIGQAGGYWQPEQMAPPSDSTYLGPSSAFRPPNSSLPSTDDSSGATMMPQAYPSVARRDSEPEDDSGNTARAHEWANQLNTMMGNRDEGTVMPVPATNDQSTLQAQAEPEREVEEGEETLFFVPLGNESTNAPSPSHHDVTVMPTKPPLHVDTRTPTDQSMDQASAVSTDPSEGLNSMTSDSDLSREHTGGANLRRAKSFAKTKDQWNFRPPAEDVYDRLEEFFPKIDLDKPVVSNAIMEGTLEPMSPRVDAGPLPSARPARQPGFNKADARKSIRFIAEGRKKHLSKIAPMEKSQPAATSNALKRTSSMWGHKVMEVTATGLKQGKVPPLPTEEVANDSNPVTMTWVKGDLIGKGTYGRVYLALNATTGDMIAVKQVEMPTTDSDREDVKHIGMIDALKGEIALLKDLDHPNVVAYLGWEESPQFLSIFLEYVPGGSVASVYRKHKKFEEEVIKSFTKQILEGLRYLHSLNILHRDLKADNILVDQEGTCKISDFGISKKTNDAYDSMISTNLKGSVFWMAPEVVHSVKGQGYSAKVDIWSLGCVVLEMWAGRRPWGDMEALAAMFQLANTRAAPPVPEDVNLSSVADDFLNKKCFASNPRDRPVAEELLVHPFITERQQGWTFADSKIGRAVAAKSKRGASES